MAGWDAGQGGSAPRLILDAEIMEQRGHGTAVSGTARLRRLEAQPRRAWHGLAGALLSAVGLQALLQQQPAALHVRPLLLLLGQAGDMA